MIAITDSGFYSGSGSFHIASGISELPVEAVSEKDSPGQYREEGEPSALGFFSVELSLEWWGSIYSGPFQLEPAGRSRACLQSSGDEKQLKTY